MNKLKKIVGGLEPKAYAELVETMNKNKADNFLYLIKACREGIKDETEVMDELNITKNSFYVLKSRLHEKIQQFITGNVVEKSEDLMKQMTLINEKCFNAPRALAISFLQKLEKDLLLYDMHYELQIVYSALKRMHLYSDKYFNYSQLYNKQIALGISHDKCEELLGEFNRILGQYYFSRSGDSIEKMLFLKREMNNHYQLNPSRQIAFIKNLIDLHLYIFCDQKQEAANIHRLFENSRQILDELPEVSPYKSRGLVLDHLSFEFYLKYGDLHSAEDYYNKVEACIPNLLLHTSISNTSRFITSRIKFLQLKGREKEIAEASAYTNFDPYDMQATVMLGIHEAMKSYYSGNTKQSVKVLIDVININSFKDLFHINLEIKLTLAFFYLKLNDKERAMFFLNSLQRKIKTEKLTNYSNALHLIKLLMEEADSFERKVSSKQKDLFTIFMARNNDEYRVLDHLASELQKKYN